MKNPLFKAYDWFDTIKEPWRFILFFFPAIVLIMGSHSGQRYLAPICIVLFLFFFITRFIHVFGKEIVQWFKDMNKLMRS